MDLERTLPLGLGSSGGSLRRCDEHYVCSRKFDRRLDRTVVGKDSRLCGGKYVKKGESLNGNNLVFSGEGLTTR